MNPWGLMFIALGFLMVVVGFKGSQHNVMKAFKGTNPKSKSTPKDKKGNPIPPDLQLQPPKLA